MINLGKVTINGSPAKIGEKVDPSKDKIKVEGKNLPPSEPNPVCLLLNKPQGYVCTNEDPYEKRTIFDLLPKRYEKIRLFCAGRLDKETEGLVVLTNDGDLAQRLAHPSSQTRKVYQVHLSKPFDLQHLAPLRRGKTVDGDRLWVDKVIALGKNTDTRPTRRLEIHLGHGKKREIRRLLAAFGYKVERLRRTKIGSLTIRRIPRGGLKILSDREINLLFSEKPAS